MRGRPVKHYIRNRFMSEESRTLEESVLSADSEIPIGACLSLRDETR
jgi:hypothetical protein